MDRGQSWEAGEWEDRRKEYYPILFCKCNLLSWVTVGSMVVNWWMSSKIMQWIPDLAGYLWSMTGKYTEWKQCCNSKFRSYNYSLSNMKYCIGSPWSAHELWKNVRLFRKFKMVFKNLIMWASLEHIYFILFPYKFLIAMQHVCYLMI